MAEKKEKKQPRLVSDIGIEVVDELDYKRQNPEQFKPIPTGLKDLDAIFGGLPRANPFVMLILATEKVGKTTLALHLARAWAMQEPCIYFGLEEQDKELVERILSAKANVNRNKIFMLDLDDVDIEAMKVAANDFKTNGDFLIQDAEFGHRGIVKAMLDMKIRMGWVDNFQLLERTGVEGFSDREKLEFLSRFFAKVRNAYGLSFGIVAQESEGGKSFGSGQMNRDANILMKISLIYPESKKGKPAGKALEKSRRIYVLRSRNRAPGECDVSFEGEYSRLGTVEPFDVNDEKKIKEINEHVEDIIVENMELFP